MFTGEPQDMAARGEFKIGLGVHREYGLHLGRQDSPVREGEHGIAGL
jgi:hypothetical protein